MYDFPLKTPGTLHRWRSVTLGAASASNACFSVWDALLSVEGLSILWSIPESIDLWVAATVHMQPSKIAATTCIHNIHTGTKQFAHLEDPRAPHSCDKSGLAWQPQRGRTLLKSGDRLLQCPSSLWLTAVTAFKSDKECQRVVQIRVDREKW